MIARLPWSTPAFALLSVSRLTCAFSKSFCEFASVVGVGGVGNGNGTSDVSWFTNASTRLLSCRRSEIPSGIDSNR